MFANGPPWTRAGVPSSVCTRFGMRPAFRRVAATKLFAAPTAWMSPVKCRLISSIGRTWDRPPPVAPPFVPNTGPRDGSRTATMPFVPRRFMAWPSPTVVRVFPSPYRVGVVPVTRTNFPWRAFRARSTAARRTEGGQDDEPLRDEERGDANGRPEFVFQLHRGMFVAHDDRMEGRHLLVSVDDRVPSDVRASIQRQVQISEDRREVIVMVPADEHRLRTVPDEPEDLLHLDPFVDQVLRELVLEVAGDDHLVLLRSVEHLAEALEDHTPLESRDRDALFRKGTFEPEVEIRDHEGPFVPQEEGEVPRRLHALRDLEAVHQAGKPRA